MPVSASAGNIPPGKVLTGGKKDKLRKSRKSRTRRNMRNRRSTRKRI